MSCFHEEQIQQYLDNEYIGLDREAIRQHLKICPLCQNALILQRQRWLQVKQSLDLLVMQQPEIPPCRIPKKAKTHRSFTEKYLWPLAVASGLLLLVLMRPLSDSDKYPINGQNLQFVVSEELDANKPITEHPLIMTVVAPDGTVSQTTIN